MGQHRTSKRFERRLSAGAWARLGVACAAGAVLLSALPAASQVAPIQQGRALDANPMVGGGGANNPIPGYVPVNGNDIITGNVTGLGGWHGPTPYISPLEFRGGTGGTGNLNNFVRQSSGPLYRGTYIGGTQTYYQPTRITAGNSGDIAPGMISNVPNAGMAATLTGPDSINPTSGQRPMMGPIGRRIELIPSSGSLPIRNFDTVGNQPAGPLNAETESNALFGLGVPAQPGLIVTPQPQPRLDQPRTPPQAETQPGEQAPPRNDMGAQQQVQNVGGTDQRVTAQVMGTGGERPVDRMVGRPTAAAEQLAATNEVYQNLLTELQKQNPQLGSPRGAAGAPGAAGTPGTAALPIKPDLDPATGLPRTPAAGEAFQSTDPTKPNYRPRGVLSPQEIAAQQTAALQAGREIKPLQTFVGPAATPFNELIATAEAQMHRGRYMDAADTYQRAVLAQPTNSLAVVGRINAELGAGMYESAAYDLKFMFGRTPALAAVRYDLPAFLNPKRLDLITKDLAELSGKKGGETSAPFLLSYIYYQTGRKAELEATMADWAKRAPQDRWIPILRKAWLEEKAPATQPAAEAAPK